jgi:hypothetical protein
MANAPFGDGPGVGEAIKVLAFNCKAVCVK